MGADFEVAGAVAFPASDDTTFVTSAAFPVDGGVTTANTVPT